MSLGIRISYLAISPTPCDRSPWDQSSCPSFRRERAVPDRRVETRSSPWSALSTAAKEYDYVKLPSKDVQLVDPSGRKVVAVIEQKDATGSKQRRTHGGLRTRGGASDASVTGKTNSPRTIPSARV